MDNDVRKLNERIQMLEDNYARLKRYLDDILYNLTAENVQEALTVRSLNAKKIYGELIAGEKLKIKNEDGSFSIDEEGVYIEQLGELEGIGERIGEVESSIAQTASAITLKVSANYTEPINTTDNPPYDDKTRMYYNTTSNVYYYWDGTQWATASSKNIYSIFRQTASGFKFVGNVEISGDMITSGIISTAGFSGSGNDRIELQREFMKFISSGSPELVKMVMGFIDDSGTKIPGIIFGAGSLDGHNRAYIVKDANSFKLIYDIAEGKISGIKFSNDGKILINDKEVAPLSDVVLYTEYASDASTWNKAVIGTYNATAGKYLVDTNQVIDKAITDDKVNDMSADKLTAGIINGNNIKVRDSVLLYDWYVDEEDAAKLYMGMDGFTPMPCLEALGGRNLAIKAKGHSIVFRNDGVHIYAGASEKLLIKDDGVYVNGIKWQQTSVAVFGE